MRALACLAVGLAIAVAGCGGESANGVLARTGDNLGKIRSGDLTLELGIATKDGKTAGFELRGPFALAEAGQLPIARITVTRLGAQGQPQVTIVSTGRNAYISSAGKTYELPPSRLGNLRSTRSNRGLAQLDIGSWMKDPKLTDDGAVEGAETDRVHADLDVVRATNDLLALSASFGAGGGAIRGRDAEQLRRAVKSATIDVYTGKHDRLLRRLLIHADLRANAPTTVRKALGALGEVDFRFELSVGHPNEPVHVQAPANAEPLPSG